MAGLAGLAFMVACSDDGDGPIDTEEKCTSAGGHIVSGTGPTIAACDASEERIGQIPRAYEGAYCCRAK